MVDNQKLKAVGETKYQVEETLYKDGKEIKTKKPAAALRVVIDRDDYFFDGTLEEFLVKTIELQKEVADLTLRLVELAKITDQFMQQTYKIRKKEAGVI